MGNEKELSISVNPLQINEYIAEKIIDSALGERLKETVEEALKGLSRYGNDPLKGAIQAEINKHILELVRTEYAPQINAAVKEAMTPEYVRDLVTGFVSSITASIDRRY